MSRNFNLDKINVIGCTWVEKPVESNPEESNDIFEGDVKMDNSEEEKYLGDLNTDDGSNSKNIRETLDYILNRDN